MIEFYDITMDEKREATQADFDAMASRIKEQHSFIGEQLWAHGLLQNDYAGGVSYALHVRVVTKNGASKYFGAKALGAWHRPKADDASKMLRDLADQIDADVVRNHPA